MRSDIRTLGWIPVELSAKEPGLSIRLAAGNAPAGATGAGTVGTAGAATAAGATGTTDAGCADGGVSITSGT